MLLGVAGCGYRPDPLPQTSPVHGKVTNAANEPVTGGMVTFEPESDPSVFTVGAIQGDGSYTLTTSRSGLKSPGAVVGANRVIVDLPFSPGQAPSPRCVLEKPVIVEPGENEIPLKLLR